MVQSKSAPLLHLLSFVVGIISVVLFLASRFQLANEILEVIMLLVGMLAMAAISILHRFIDYRGGGPLVQVTFNEAQVRSNLKSVVDAEDVVYREEVRVKEPSWEPTSESLLIQDPTLALAKLRIDMERELRRLANEFGVDANSRKVSILSIIDALVKKEKLPPQVVSTINEILPICNKAIHGFDVEASVAQSVLAVGADVLTLLKSEKFGVGSNRFKESS